MIAGDASLREPMLIVGFNQFLDFYPSLIAANLNKQNILAKDISLDLKSLRYRKFVSGMVLARLFDESEFRQEVIDSLKPRLGRIGRIGFPAVLGLDRSPEVVHHLESALGVPIFEIPGLPPSIPGIRLHKMLGSAIESQHGSIFNGMQVSNADVENHNLKALGSIAAARVKSHTAKTYVLATGGILGGGVITHESGYAQESVLELPVDVPRKRTQWFRDEFLSRESHPIHVSGLFIDSSFQPVDEDGQVIIQNLFTVGSAIGNCDPIRERSKEGIALATGYKVGENLSTK
jgi:glycerol-3-phosphate dehydrogenase subunit B